MGQGVTYEADLICVRCGHAAYWHAGTRRECACRDPGGYPCICRKFLQHPEPPPANEAMAQEIAKIEMESLRIKAEELKNSPYMAAIKKLEYDTKDRTHPDNWKETNPKDACGFSKTPLSTISGPVLFELGIAMLEGAFKYGRHNYRASGVRASIYYDAAMRHLISWWEGEDIDPDSGISHLVKAMACMAVIRDAQIQNNWVDDRPPRSPEFMADYNAKVKALIEKYPDPVPPFTEKPI